jgi:hypothetical protein
MNRYGDIVTDEMSVASGKIVRLALNGRGTTEDQAKRNRSLKSADGRVATEATVAWENNVTNKNQNEST